MQHHVVRDQATAMEAKRRAEAVSTTKGIIALLGEADRVPQTALRRLLDAQLELVGQLTNIQSMPQARRSALAAVARQPCCARGRCLPGGRPEAGKREVHSGLKQQGGLLRSPAGGDSLVLAQCMVVWWCGGAGAAAAGGAAVVRTSSM